MASRRRSSHLSKRARGTGIETAVIPRRRAGPALPAGQIQVTWSRRESAQLRHANKDQHALNQVHGRRCRETVHRLGGERHRVDPWEPALTLARQNIASAGLDSRIEVRSIPGEDVSEVDRYDLAWIASVFMPDEVVPRVAQRVLDAPSQVDGPSLRCRSRMRTIRSRTLCGISALPASVARSPLPTRAPDSCVDAAMSTLYRCRYLLVGSPPSSPDGRRLNRQVSTISDPGDCDRADSPVIGVGRSSCSDVRLDVACFTG